MYAQVYIDRGRGEISGPSKDEGNMNIAPQAHRVSPGHEPRQNRHDGAEQPEPLKGRVQSAGAEHPPGANDTPDYGSRVEDLGVCARVLVLLVVGTHVFC